MGQKEKLIRRLKSRPRDYRPHPRKELLDYQIKQLIDKLEQEDLI